MSWPVHPLLRMAIPEGKHMWVYANKQLTATGWAQNCGVELEMMTWVGPADLRRIRMKKKTPIVVLYDYTPALLAQLRSCGFRTFTPEGFEYKGGST